MTTKSDKQALQQAKQAIAETSITPSNPHDLSEIWDMEESEAFRVQCVRDTSINLSKIPVDVAEILFYASQATGMVVDVIATQILTDCICGDGSATSLLRKLSDQYRKSSADAEQRRLAHIKRQKEHELRVIELEQLQVAEAIAHGGRP